MDARAQAKNFIENEKQFHLGVLTTEQPHPRTRRLSETIQRDTAVGIQMLLDVDSDILPVAHQVLQSAAYAEMVDAISECVARGGMICFSGCGAGGRLAILLEAMWRTFWHQAAEATPLRAADYRATAARAYSIMTGGDRALIRSVENFEDYQVFGRRQVAEAGLGENDLLLAIGEDGVISSVIGTIREAAARGARVFFTYNNPRAVLMENMQRARDVLELESATGIELTTGPMALTGSTRMQATTIALLVYGAALEQALTTSVARDNLKFAARAQSIPPSAIPETYAALFRALLAQLTHGDALRGLTQLLDLETNVYAAHGRVTYIAERYLLDILGDTTERTPTFMLPPFRKYDDATAPIPWAFARDPLRPTPEAWAHMLKRAPRGLQWTRADYEEMQVQREIIERPPALGNDEIYKYRIGSEEDETRYNAPASALIWVHFDEAQTPALADYMRAHAARYTHPTLVTLGAAAFELPGVQTIHIPLHLPATAGSLFAHLAIKLVCNTLSTGVMGKLGRIMGNWMIQVDAINKKLIDRAIRIVADLGSMSYQEACYALYETIRAPEMDRQTFHDSYVIQTLRKCDGFLETHPHVPKNT